ncbi:hypothetical protein FJ208_02615 [Candidatus Gribaldobacteria bacterium]|nr:hypothetical protein [Candidatus Gribaldobacteria bacterium]
MIQGVREQQGKEVVKGIGGLFLRLLGEKLLEQGDESIIKLYEFIAKTGDIPDEDLPDLRARLKSMWEALPREIQWAFNEYHYSNLIRKT